METTSFTSIKTHSIIRRKRMNRIFVIGDIHGMYDKLISLLNKIIHNYKFSNDDTMVFVGDYIDRGNESFEVVDYLVNLNKEYENIIFLMGNHEDMLLNCVRNNIESYHSPCKLFMYNGGNKSIQNYKKNGYDLLKWKIPESHKIFFQNLKLFYENDEIFISHAGIRPNISLDKQLKEDLLWIRDDFILSDRDFGKLIITGHTIFEEGPLVQNNKICIDTGAFLQDGHLTNLILPDLEFINTKE